MRRPAYYNQEWRLDQILKRKAEQGVKIFVIVYREVEVSLQIAQNNQLLIPSSCRPPSPAILHIRNMLFRDSVQKEQKYTETLSSCAIPITTSSKMRPT
jgi:hypothetical protein